LLLPPRVQGHKSTRFSASKLLALWDAQMAAVHKSLGKETAYLFATLVNVVSGHPEEVIPQFLWTAGRLPHYNAGLECNQCFPSLVLLYIRVVV